MPKGVLQVLIHFWSELGPNYLWKGMQVILNANCRQRTKPVRKGFCCCDICLDFEGTRVRIYIYLKWVEILLQKICLSTNKVARRNDQCFSFAAEIIENKYFFKWSSAAHSKGSLKILMQFDLGR